MTVATDGNFSLVHKKNAVGIETPSSGIKGRFLAQYDVDVFLSTYNIEANTNVVNFLISQMK